MIDSTKTLIEQKSSTVNIDDEEIFQQAKRYNDALEFSRKARWIITCNFKEFRVFDMDKRYPEREPIKISLFELQKKFAALNFLVELQDKISYERELSIQADDALSDLNKLCMRLVFCLYAESIDIFGKHKIFRDYLRGALNNTVLIIPDATTYHFGILTSSIHMAWMRAVAGRMKSDYQYSATVVYNTFP